MGKLKFSDELAHGPIQNRHITDLLFCIFFIVFCVGMMAAAVYGWSQGDPRTLLLGWDSDQRGCGFSAETENYPYLYFPKSPNQDEVKKISDGDYSDAMKLLNNGVCVKECPSKDQTEEVECKSTKSMDENYKFLNCVYYPGASVAKMNG
jgi:hypothetical protein